MEDSHHDVGAHIHNSNVEQSNVMSVERSGERGPIKAPPEEVKRIKDGKLWCVVDGYTSTKGIDPVRKFSACERPGDVRKQRQDEMGVVRPGRSRVLSSQ